ncbi:MAG: transglutaminase-like domain-containing protein [Treponema sp.]|nr:transglutaminase-like domain-containing protein [Treponema sp.]
MKKNIFIILIIGSFILSSCFNILLPDNKTNDEQISIKEFSSASLKIFIPDYKKMAEQNSGRAIAPQTAYIRLSIADDQGIFIQHGELLELNINDIIPVVNAPVNFPGGIWSGTFSQLECKVYNAGSLRIELLDLNKRVITQGLNQADVTVTPYQSAQAVFFTTPEIYNNISGNLAPDEMRFWKVSMMAGFSYKLTLSAEGSYPDIVVFNNDGTFKEYHSISNSAEAIIIFDPDVTADYYLGLWADDGAVNSYSIAMSYNIDHASFQTDFSEDFSGWTASSSGSGSILPVIVIEDGKSIIEFASRYMSNGGRVTLSRTINITEPGFFSFNIKTDIGGASPVDTFFKFYLNNVEVASYEGLGGSWRNGSFYIPEGSHEVRCVLEKNSNFFYNPPNTNKVWLTDISISPDITAFLDMYPKGPKDTYVGGFPIQFNANALRPDGSIRSGISGITYSGPGVDPVTGLFTPPAAPGTYRVTASLDGKIVNSDIITVHPADYLQRPYTNLITGKTYYGYQGEPGSMVGFLGYLTITSPAENYIDADGFVTFAGELRYGGYINMSIEKEEDPSLVTNYLIPQGNFCIRVWLRFGAGLYRINIGLGSYQETFIVNNTCTDTGVDGDPRFLYPSSVVQSDDFRITNLVTDILYGITNEAEKIKLIHDYIVKNTVYDADGYLTGVRKPQDALGVLETRYHVDPQYGSLGHYLAVCEGYSNVTAALLRAAGIETRYVSSTAMNHAWNHVYTGGSWKFLDTTWNDPIYIETGNDLGPNYVSYDYYLLSTLNGLNGSHYDYVVNNSRSLVPVIPKMRGMPDGWY